MPHKLSHNQINALKISPLRQKGSLFDKPTKRGTTPEVLTTPKVVFNCNQSDIRGKWTRYLAISSY